MAPDMFCILPVGFVSLELALVVLAGLVLFGLAFGLMQWFSRSGSGPAPLPKPPSSGPLESALKRSAEKRGALRREGSVEVVVTGDCFAGETLHGSVLDRSTSGVSLLLSRAVNDGARLRIRPAHDSLIPTVEVEVRHCRQDGHYWIVGCQFVKSPPYAVLMSFG